MDGVRTASPRLEGLDALRGIAAMSVMLYHYTSRYGWWLRVPPPRPSLDFPHGNFGVELFFIISGFVIFMTLERSRSLADFLMFRFARLYPAYWAALSFTIALTVVAGAAGIGGFGFGGHDPAGGWLRIAANTTMLPALFGQLAIDGSYWSLFYEVWFYVLAGYVWFTVRPRRPELCCAIWLASSLLFRCAQDSGYGRALGQLANAPFSDLFTIGIMLYQIRSARASPATWAVLGLAIAVSFSAPDVALSGLSSMGYPLVVAGLSGCVWLASGPGLRLCPIAPLRFLGRISFPLYLVHQAAGFLIIARLEDRGVSADLAVALTGAYAIGVAWVISMTVEFPAQAWLRERYWASRVSARAVESRTAPAAPVGAAHGR